MKRNLILIALFSLSLIAIGLAGRTVASDASSVEPIETLSMEEICDQLSANSEYEFNVIEGEVYIARVADPHALVDPDCTRSVEKCKAEYYARPASFTFALKPIGGGQSFRVSTPPETLGAVLHKEPYMAVGKRYRFCARRYTVEYGETIPDRIKERKLYRIDNIETIQEILEKADEYDNTKY